MSDERDDQLLAELGSAAEWADPVPARLLDGARAAYTWRTVDAELALLQFDSASAADTGVRSSDGAVHLSFAAAGATIDVELTADRIIGQITPPVPSITVSSPTGEQIEVGCDALGQFTIIDRPAGIVRLGASGAEGPVATDWFSC